MVLCTIFVSLTGISSGGGGADTGTEVSGAGGGI